MGIKTTQILKLLRKMQTFVNKKVIGKRVKNWSLTSSLLLNLRKFWANNFLWVNIFSDYFYGFEIGVIDIGTQITTHIKKKN
jgi:hypothetical protein